MSATNSAIENEHTCSQCGRQIGKFEPHKVLDDGHRLCSGCYPQLWEEMKKYGTPYYADSSREQTQSKPVTSQPSEQPTNIVYQCHCPRCQGLLEATKDFYGMIFFECVCGCGFKLYKDWTKKVPWSDSFTGHIQGVLDARD